MTAGSLTIKWDNRFLWYLKPSIFRHFDRLNDRRLNNHDGLIKTLLDDIIPRLNRDVPNQPSEAELAADEKLHRFMIVFDREGYSTVIELVEISIFLKNLPGSVSHFARIEKMSMKTGMTVNFRIMK